MRISARHASAFAAATEQIADTLRNASPQALAPVDDAFGRLLLRWQDEHDDKAFHELVVTARLLITSVAERSLRDACRDGVLIEEVVSLVLNHLRRLPKHHQAVANTPAGERAVRSFKATPTVPNAGRRYLVWLTQRRALDIARRERRNQRRCRCYTASNPHQVAAAIMQASRDQQVAVGLQALQDDRLAWVQAMLALLDPADRLLMEMVLEGKTLATIAHMLECSEGTVSRRRQRIEQSPRAAAHTHAVASFASRG